MPDDAFEAPRQVVAHACSRAAHAQDIFRSAFNAAWHTYGETDPAFVEEIAHRVAWPAVKERYCAGRHLGPRKDAGD